MPVPRTFLVLRGWPIGRSVRGGRTGRGRGAVGLASGRRRRTRSIVVHRRRGGVVRRRGFRPVVVSFRSRRRLRLKCALVFRDHRLFVPSRRGQESGPRRRLQRARMLLVLLHSGEHISSIEPHVPAIARRCNQCLLDLIERAVVPLVRHGAVDDVGDHLGRHPALHRLAISIGPGRDAVRGHRLLEAIQRDAVHRLGRGAAPDRLIGREGDLGDALGGGVIQRPFGDHVHQRPDILGLVGLDNIESIVREGVMNGLLERVALGLRQRAVARQLRVDVFNDVLPPGRLRRLQGQRQRRRYEYRSLRHGCAVLL